MSSRLGDIFLMHSELTGTPTVQILCLPALGWHEAPPPSLFFMYFILLPQLFYFLLLSNMSLCFFACLLLPSASALLPSVLCPLPFCPSALCPAHFPFFPLVPACFPLTQPVFKVKSWSCYLHWFLLPFCLHPS